MFKKLSQPPMQSVSFSKCYHCIHVCMCVYVCVYDFVSSRKIKMVCLSLRQELLTGVHKPIDIHR